MMEPPAEPSAEEPPRVLDRPDCRGTWSVAWPVLCLAVIGLLTVRACVVPLPVYTPAAPGAPGASGAATAR